MNSHIQMRIEAWLDEPFDKKTREAIKDLVKTNPKELEDAFYTDLAFGTGGLRGIMGIGTNRMNEYTIRKTTQGLAKYIKKEFPSEENAVVIGFDSRHHSKEFAQEAANVLSYYGISVFILKELRPTPFISFACRHFKAKAAIMITASHNPKEYNGYKVYWQDGAQVVPPHDVGIMQTIAGLSGYSAPLPPLKNLIHLVDESLDLIYIQALNPLQTFPLKNKDSGKDLSIVFTSLHGTGITLAPKALNGWGFSNIRYVEKQIIPDGDFPTVKYPNPEYQEALQLGMDLLKDSESDILLATDPDADRLGVVVRHEGKPVILSGNETASLCIEYLCRALKKKKVPPVNPAFITTIVSTDLIDAICSSYNMACFRVLTGFKYIGEKIHQWESLELESNNYHSFIFGAEESYGYLYGTHARDKDAIISCCLIAEMALHFKQQGKTLVHFLDEVYQKYGVFREAQASLSFLPGKEGMESLEKAMKNLRANPPQVIGGKKVLLIEDYKEGLHSLPPSNVLFLRLEDDIKVIVRPSGTEPKIKVYGGIRVPYKAELETVIKEADEKLQNLLQECKEKFLG
jgi:phosphomannomutase